MALAVVGQPAAVSAAHTASMSSVRTAQLASRGEGSAAMAAPKPVGSASAGSGPSTSRYTPGPRPRIAFAVPIDGCEPPNVARAPARCSSSSTPAPKSGTTHMRWSIVAIAAILRSGRAATRIEDMSDVPAEVTDWCARFAAALGIPAPTPDEIETLLDLAGIAAHASQTAVRTGGVLARCPCGRRPRPCAPDRSRHLIRDGPSVRA